MPLLDLSLVTQTLMSLIDKHIHALPVTEQAKLPASWSVLPSPPDQLSGEGRIGVYLYHVVEDPYRKNLPPPGTNFPPVALTPVGLHLYYQVSAHSDAAAPDAGIGSETEQRLMGYAIKALHDHPVVDDTTQINGSLVFPTDLQGTDNRFVIDLLPIQPDEAPHYWTPGSKPLRLAAYYKVSVTLLEPEPVRSSTGRVLLYGVYTFVRGSPRLDGSRSEVTFRLPGESADRTVEVRPAEAAVGGGITFFGSSLAGDSTTLLIKNPRLPQPIEVGSDWGVLASDNEIGIVVQPMLATSPTLPGLYSAIAKVTETRLMPDKTVRSFPKTSNEAPFIVAPTVGPLSGPDANGDLTLTGGIFRDPALALGAPPPPGNVQPPGSVQVFIGPNSLTPKVGTNNPGEFELLDPTHLKFHLPAGLSSGETVLFRVIVNGAESAPNWITVP